MSAALKWLSADDLKAIEAGDMGKVSTQGLKILAEGKNPNIEAGRNAPGAVQGLASVVQGPLFGFGDEIGGAIGGAIDTVRQGGSFSDNYAANRDTLRGMQQKQQEDNPITTGVTQMLASGPLMLRNVIGQGATAVAPNVAARYTQWLNAPRTGMSSLGVRSVNAGANAAGYGAVAGLGNSEADTVGGLVTDTAKGAVISGALGAATPGAGALAMGAYGQVAPRVSQSAAVEFARQKVAEALSRDARGSVFESGASNAGSQAAARFNRLGPEARVVDAGGQNTRQLLDTVATLPGRSKNLVENAIHDRQATRGDRLTTAAETAMGTQGRRLNEGIEAWVESRGLLAAPIYRQVYSMRVQPTPQLETIVRAAEELGAAAHARRIATANRSEYTLSTQPAPAAPGSSLMNNGQPQQATQWSMRDLDYLKQGLDDIVQSNIDDTGRMNKVGAAVNQLRRDLVNQLDQMTTGPNGQSIYRIARETYAGPSALIDAARRGRHTFNQDEAAIRQAMSGLSGSEADAFRLGAFEAMRNKLGKMGGQTEILNMWRDRATREKLQAVFGDERSFRQFAVTTAREARLKELEKVGRGSQTASRQFGAGDVDVAPMAQAVTSVMQGSPSGLVNASMNAWNRVRTPEPVRDEIGGLLLSRDPNVMRELELLTPLLSAERNRRAATGGRFMGLISN